MNSLILLLAVLPGSFILGNPVPGLEKSGIVGGREARLIPYQVSIGRFRHNCGGSIVSKRIVVTAAHCMLNDRRNNIFPYWVRAGTRTLNQGGIKVRVDDYVIHPNYNAVTLDYDIAILYLHSSLEFSTNIQPIHMASATDSLATGTAAMITGWGYEKEGSIFGAGKLKIAQVPIVSEEDCQTTIRDWTDRMICAGYQGGGIDACTYDSGGPLVANGQLFGVISSGLGCARPNEFGVYTSIPVLRLWIDKTIEILKNRNSE